MTTTDPAQQTMDDQTNPTSAKARISGPELWRYRYLAWNFAQRDLKAKYKGTVIGWAWSLIVPVAVVLIYSLVFSVIFRAEPPPFADGRPGVFAVWFVVGLVPWSLFAAAVTTGMGGLLASGSLLQKVYIPSYVPVVGSALAALVQAGIELGIVAAMLLGFQNVGWTWLLTPLWLAIFAIFATATGYILAVANVFLRDVGQIVAVALQLLFFLTPIIYPLSFVPEKVGPIPLQTLISANPLAQFIGGFRALLYDLQLPSLAQLGYVTVWTLAALLLAWIVFRRRGRDVGEEI
ncbi:MAG: ABC transporter permease [Actinomycetia bacterium]|nr:ABC transporter permease [Actinomycetes bacterium]